MGKGKTPHASLKGKKPVNTAKKERGKTVKPVTRNPGHIANKLKRSEMYGKYLQEKRKRKAQARLQREKEAEALGEDAKRDKPVARTLDNTREVDPTMVLRDEEVASDETEDEFARYFDSETPPKVLVTTRPRPSRRLFFFIADLQRLIPELHFYPRKSFSVKEICAFAQNRDFTHLIVLGENAKHCNGMTISHLSKEQPGPTAFFKVSNVVTSQNIPEHGASTRHIPELNLHGFGTRLGHRVGRMLGSLFPHDAQFEGRQVATFHNQRDYIFVRHHRYIFEERSEKQLEQLRKKKQAEIAKEAKLEEAKREQRFDNSSDSDSDGGDASIRSKQQQWQPDEPPPLTVKERVKARLQELGPRFTLKLRWIQEGTFDTQFGEYEWIHKRKEMDTTRRRFHL